MAETVNNVLYGGPILRDLLDGTKSLGEFCVKSLLKHGNKVLIINASTLEEITGSQLLLRSIRVAECLLHNGIQAGDRIGISSENQLEYSYVTFGAFLVGATVAPVCVTLAESEFLHAVNISTPKIIFISPSVVNKVSSVSTQISFIEKIVLFSHEASESNFESYASFINNPDVKSINEFTCEARDIKENGAIIFCSSGTTGLFKGVELSQSNIFYSMEMDAMPYNVKLLCVTSYSHLSGMMTMISMALKGITAILLPKIDNTSFLQCIEKHKVNALLLIPPYMKMLAKSPLVVNYDLSSIMAIMCVADVLTENIINAVRNRIGKIQILQAYASTETMVVLSQNQLYNKIGSIGVLIKGVWGKVIDPETGTTLGPCEEGEMLFKTNTIMKGYFGNPEATRLAIDDDGFLHSGDLGYYDENGEWFIVDRLKEMIKYKTYQVPPVALETILLLHPNVAEACVVGLPDEEAGELPLAFVIKNGDVTEQEIIDFVAERISDFRHLRGGVRFISEIPRNSNGKILRRGLRNSLRK